MDIHELYAIDNVVVELLQVLDDLCKVRRYGGVIDYISRAYFEANADKKRR